MTTQGQRADIPDGYAREFVVEEKEAGRNIAKLTPVLRRLSRLEYMVRKEIITGRQYTAGAWLAERWSAYFTPGTGSGIEDHAPVSIPSDPLARWTRGQRTTDARGKPRTPPPTFRPKRPSDGRRAHDGWPPKRLDALQRWVRANRLLESLSAQDRTVTLLVAVEGLSFKDAYRQMTGRAAGGKQVHAVKRALQRGLDAIADEIEPQLRDVAA